MLFGNVMAADTAGGTYYVYNGAVPRRDPRFDWTGAVDGATPPPNGGVSIRWMSCLN